MDHPFGHLIDLASEQFGGKAMACSDDFFASMDNLIKTGRGVFIPDRYTDRGKWMDGWESRRRRGPGHDWCIIRLGAPGRIHGFDVDTNHFLGNHPPHCSIDACFAPDFDLNDVEWTEILPKHRLDPGSQHLLHCSSDRTWTHVRLNIYPDGGVARLRVFGRVSIDWKAEDEDALIDLAAAVHGGKSMQCNDMFFSHMDNLLMPGRGKNMGDGWETKRNRTPNNCDWVVIRLAHRGIIRRIIVDTAHFKGNFPDLCSLEGCLSQSDDTKNAHWTTILPESKLTADAEHDFENKLAQYHLFSHVRFKIFPDGGVSRLRLWGHIRNAAMSLAQFNELSTEEAGERLRQCCGSKRWVSMMMDHRPFHSLPGLLETADALWMRTDVTDWLEAFEQHPRIGDLSSVRKKFEDTKAWASNEQSGVHVGNEEMLKRLADGNQRYEAKFGHIFIVFATGKSAGEMLALLEERMDNDTDTEARIAMKEQAKITRLRLQKLLT